MYIYIYTYIYIHIYCSVQFWNFFCLLGPNYGICLHKFHFKVLKLDYKRQYFIWCAICTYIGGLYLHVSVIYCNVLGPTLIPSRFPNLRGLDNGMWFFRSSVSKR